MKKAIVLIVLIMNLVPAFAQTQFDEKDKPSNYGNGTLDEKEKKIEEISRIFNARIKEVNTTNTFHYINKTYQVRLLLAQRDAMIKEVILRSASGKKQ